MEQIMNVHSCGNLQQSGNNLVKEKQKTGSNIFLPTENIYHELEF